MTETIVGQPVTRVDAFEKVVGAAVYGADINLQGMLHGAVLRSPYAHARILSVDVTAARCLPGVKAIATGACLAGVLSGEGVKDMPFLAYDKVRYVGDPVAAVAAEDAATARRAVELIKVEYEELPYVLDPREAMDKTAPLLHEGLASYKRLGVLKPVPGTNIVTVNEYRQGDVEQGFRESDYVFQDEFSSHIVQHGAVEPHSAVAQVDVRGKITVWAPNDSPHRLRKDLADALNLPLTQIRAISTLVGGGFGAKGGLKAEPIAIALALVTDHRPVKVVFSRQEVFQATLVRHATVVNIKTGVKADGTIVAREVQVIWDTGAYAEKGPMVCSQATASSAGPYRIPNARLIGYCVYTNKPPAGAYRGYGTPQMAWAYESQMDLIARKLGLDPLALRLKNALREGDVNPVGNVVHSVGLGDCLAQVGAALGWKEREHRPRVVEDGRYRGLGIACASKNTKTPSGSGAVLYMSQDAHLNIAMATVEVGQGARTIMAQIASEVLGLPIANMSFSEPDTDVTPFDSSTTSSRSTFHMGNAIKLAAEDIRTQLIQLAACYWHCPPEKVRAGGGKLWKAEEPAQSVTYEQLLRDQYGAGACIVGRGFYYPPSEQGKAMHASPSLFWMYAAHGVEIEIEPRTGRIEVKRLVAAVDTGRPINPINCLQQIEGGGVHAIGTALFEEMVFDGKGRLLNPNLHDYKMPTALDAPDLIPCLVEAPHKDGPFGAKGIGEIMTTPVAAAIANAIEDAIGLRMRQLPLTAERVWKACQKVEGGDAEH